ncbi:MAG: hypothetical protein CL670_15380 [Balneola sp.]|jgi:PST family polysaccharide transporter|nr:hypothetical protein [Balneola sp.]MBE80541.1 hypothetical protein [Balneola sp.]|tara:strand:- start:1415 stop:2848 length:1434 start_codon:yes stop_codon:yes gene_type:complete
MSLKQKTLSSFKWTSLDQGLAQGINLIFGIVLARLLMPSDFGLVAMVTVFTGFLNLFIDSGLGAALIYTKEITEGDKSSMFWSNIGIGILLSVLLVLSAPLIANFYGEPILTIITYFIAFNFIISSTTPVQIALFKKELNFKSLFLARIIALILSGIIGIVMAYNGYGVWSLIGKLLLMTALYSLLLWLFSEWKPKKVFDWVRMKDLLNYSLPLLGNNILGYAKNNLDTIIVGKVLGSSSLGIYNKSYQLMVLPGNQITGVMGEVLFSSFSKVNHDIDKLWHAYLNATKGILILSVFMSLSIYFAADSFVMNVLGEQWSRAIPIIKIMALVGLILPTAKSIGALFNATGKTKLALKISLVTTPIYLGCVITGAFWGLEGVAYGVVLAIIGTAVPQLHYAVKLVNRTVFELFSENRRILFSSVLCFAIMHLIVSVINDQSELIWLFVMPISVLIILTLLGWTIFRKDSKMIYSILKNR